MVKQTLASWQFQQWSGRLSATRFILGSKSESRGNCSSAAAQTPGVTVVCEASLNKEAEKETVPQLRSDTDTKTKI